jgi:D-glycero-alpha-D-manno-heptose-7-phosphate kinase
MILSRVPLRVPLAGGGTDSPSFIAQHGGMIISAAISQYVYVAVNQTFATPGWTLKYSETEHAEVLEDVKHPLIRTALAFYAVPERTEVACLADVPGGTGLGSSGAFTVALCQAFSEYVGHHLPQRTLAAHASEIELDILRRGGGRQDHYSCALGDLQVLEFHRDGAVSNQQLYISQTTFDALESSLHLYFTGICRDADQILTTQTTDGLSDILAMGHESRKHIENDDLSAFGRSLNDHWNAKKLRSPLMTSEHVDRCYNVGMSAGAIGGKLVGAGSGGFMLFLTDQPTKLATAMTMNGYDEVPFTFDTVGACLINTL